MIGRPFFPRDQTGYREGLTGGGAQGFARDSQLKAQFFRSIRRITGQAADPDPFYVTLASQQPGKLVGAGLSLASVRRVGCAARKMADTPGHDTQPAGTPSSMTTSSEALCPSSRWAEIPVFCGRRRNGPERLE